MKVKRIKDEEMYIITKDITRDIREELGVSMTLAELGRRLDKAITDADVEYGSVRVNNVKGYMRAVKIPEEAFLDWVLQRIRDKNE